MIGLWLSVLELLGCAFLGRWYMQELFILAKINLTNSIIYSVFK
jgi:hypothetical protein